MMKICNILSVCNAGLFRYFLLSDGMNISIYSYEGRLVSTPKLLSSKPDCVNINTVSISPDTIAVRDATDTKCKSPNGNSPRSNFLPFSCGVFRYQWKSTW